MTNEFNAFLKNSTWVLSSASKATCCWLQMDFPNHNADGSIESHKASLVAKSFHQLACVNFDETFNLVINATTIRSILSLTTSYRWSMHQLDLKNALFHDDLVETVYMTQTPGFIDYARPTHVCHLQKANYGLKQVPRAWFHRLSSFLLQSGCTQCRVDHSLYIYRPDYIIMLQLLYVDGIILTGNQLSQLSAYVHTLGKEFQLSDLGPLYYFLDLGVIFSPVALLLSQLKYTIDLMKKISLTNCKPCTTPCVLKHNSLLTMEISCPMRLYIASQLVLCNISHLPDLTFLMMFITLLNL